MIPDGTPPEAIIVAVVTVVFVACAMAAALFWYTLPRTMSSTDDPRSIPARSAKPVLDQSVPTSLNVQTSAPVQTGMGVSEDRDLPDMEAENTTPRVSRYLTDDEFIVFLATQKLRNGKYRLSANDIVKTVHGDRTEVLRIVREVREVREPAPEFRPLTDEQQQLRAQLQLDQH